jgi:hypothetical protein
MYRFRHACRALKISTSDCRYKPFKKEDDNLDHCLLIQMAEKSQLGAFG